MKRVIFTSLCFALFLTACQKEDLTSAATSEIAQKTSIVSDWKTVPSDSWQLSASTSASRTYSFSYTASQPIVENDALVAYLKGYNFSDASMNRPMALPFEFFSASENSTSAYSWELAKEGSTITVKVTMAPDMEQEFLNAKAPVQFQYAVMGAGYLSAKGLTPQAVNRLGYKQVMSIAEPAI